MATIGIIVAAGASRRMGRPKALLPLGGSTLLGVHLAALGRVVERRRVVLGAGADVIAASLPVGVERIDNPAWERGHLGDSLALGLAGLTDDDRVIFSPIDAPPAEEGLLRALLGAEGAAAAAFGGQRGHPVAFGVGAVRPHLPQLRLDRLLAGATAIEAGCADVLANLNTPAAWAAWAQGR